MSKKKALSEKLGMLNQQDSVLTEPDKEHHPIESGDESADEETAAPADSKYGINANEPMTDEERDALLIDRTLNDEKRRNRWKKIGRWIHGMLITACVYVSFLIYGMAVTTFEYAESDSIQAQRMTKDDIREKKEYEKISFFYEACRCLYEKTLLLDYRLGAGEEYPLSFAPEYEALLDEVEMLSIKTDAVTVDTGYSQVKSMLLTWIKDDIAVYLQNMSAAISQNNMETANNALQDKDRVYTDFMLITQNMAAFGENIKGIDLSIIRHWTPEKYIDEEINGEQT